MMNPFERTPAIGVLFAPHRAKLSEHVVDLTPSREAKQKRAIKALEKAQGNKG